MALLFFFNALVCFSFALLFALVLRRPDWWADFAGMEEKECTPATKFAMWFFIVLGLFFNLYAMHNLAKDVQYENHSSSVSLQH